MDITTSSTLVTGGASGLGLAAATRIVAAGGRVVLLDLPTSAGAERALELGDAAIFVPGDVTDDVSVRRALDCADAMAPLRGVVHCAGRGATVRVLDGDDQPFAMELFETVIRTNLIGSFNILRHAAATMMRHETDGEERGSVVLTASVAAYEGQIGQLPYAASKAGVVGMTIVAARDLAKRGIRVNTIAPGIFDTPILDRHGDEVKERLAAAIPFPHRLGRAEEYASLAEHLLENSYINGETVRLDGAVRMGPR